MDCNYGVDSYGIEWVHNININNNYLYIQMSP